MAIYLPKLVKRIDSAIAGTQSAITGASELEPRMHLGASVVGRECLREVWYSWRWASLIHFEGRMLRLFNRGHEEEPRFVRWLERVGAVVETVDPESQYELWHDPDDLAYVVAPWGQTDQESLANWFLVTDDPRHVAAAFQQGITIPEPKQRRFSGYMGHFGGALDAIITNLDGLQEHGILPEHRLLGEFKTHNDNSFKNLVKEGVARSKPEHAMQAEVYRKEFACDAVLYCGVNKNDDHMHLELLMPDESLYNLAIGRAQFIINSMTPPPRIPYASPSNFKCKFCDHRHACHFGLPWMRNCRTCKFAVPIDGGKWGCNFYGKEIPRDFLTQGCANHVQIHNAD